MTKNYDLQVRVIALYIGLHSGDTADADAPLNGDVDLDTVFAAEQEQVIQQRQLVADTGNTVLERWQSQ